jgi:hypothetical protein
LEVLARAIDGVPEFGGIWGFDGHQVHARSRDGCAAEYGSGGDA